MDKYKLEIAARMKGHAEMLKEEIKIQTEGDDGDGEESTVCFTVQLIQVLIDDFNGLATLFEIEGRK